MLVSMGTFHAIPEDLCLNDGSSRTSASNPALSIFCLSGVNFPASIIYMYNFFLAMINYKENVLLSREISLKVICEKVKFSNCDFCNNCRDLEWTYI